MEGYVIMDTEAREPAAHIILKIQQTPYSGIILEPPWAMKIHLIMTNWDFEMYKFTIKQIKGKRLCWVYQEV